MSWGAGEFSSEMAYDSHFTTPTGHVRRVEAGGRITFVAASGDSGKAHLAGRLANVGASAARPSTSAAGAYSSESAWSGSGGGIKRVRGEVRLRDRRLPELPRSGPRRRLVRRQPEHRLRRLRHGGLLRPQPAGSRWAAPAPGAPQWPPWWPSADQGRALLARARSTASRRPCPPSTAWAAATDFHDITSGSNGYAAAKGYDLATGVSAAPTRTWWPPTSRSGRSPPRPRRPFRRQPHAQRAPWATRSASMSRRPLPRPPRPWPPPKVRQPFAGPVRPRRWPPPSPPPLPAPMVMGVEDAVLAARPAGQADARQWAPSASTGPYPADTGRPDRTGLGRLRNGRRRRHAGRP